MKRAVSPWVSVGVGGVLLLGACSKGGGEEPSPAAVEAPKPEPVKAAPAPMTDAELAAVVESARQANKAIDTSEAARKKLPKARDGLPSWETLIRHYNDRVRGVDKVFDQTGAERLLKEHPDHPDAAGVRRVLHRVELTRLRRDFMVAYGEWSQAAKRLEEQQKLPDWWTRLKVLDEALLERLRETRHQLNILQTSMKPDEKRNLKEARELQDSLRKSIDERRQELREIAPRVKEEEFVVQGGIEVTAQELWKDFDDNEIAALQKYRGKRVKLSGKVHSVTADFRDQPQVHLRTKNRYQTVTISGGPVSEAAKLKKGQEIWVICGNITEVAGTPICTLE